MDTTTYKDFFGSSSERMSHLRQKVIEATSTICTDRAKIITEVYRNNGDKPIVIKRAIALKSILEKMSIFIEGGELIVGNQASKLRAAPIFPEYAVDWILEELDNFDKRTGDKFFIDNVQKEELRGILKYWEAKTLKEKALALMPPDSRLLYDIGIIKTEGNITSGDGHIAVNFKKVLEYGISGLMSKVKRRLGNLDRTNYSDFRKTFFLEAILVVFESVIRFAHRYADLALEMASKEKDEYRKRELLNISSICRKVPEYPASNFHEAVQSVWFIQLILQIESNGHSVSYGRLDQYLYPYYKNDVENGVIVEEEACELLENLWIKTCSINKIRSWSHSRFSAGGTSYQNVTIGGQTQDGIDAVNELSYLVLKSVGRMRLTQPNLSVRYHSGISQDFLLSCVELIKLGFGMPAFNNDELIIPAFMELGVKREDAFDYSAIGCVEVAVPGKWGYRCNGMGFFNFPKTLMAALNNGVDLLTKKRIHDGCGHFKDMESFEDVTKAWSRTVKDLTRQSVIIDNCSDMAIEQEVPDILCSALTDDCIERGLHLKEGGALYDFISGLQVGIANLGNSLAAIKKLVYEEKVLTREQLWDAIETNFEGEQGERIRQLCLNGAPKYGNDDDYVDSLLANAYKEYIDEILKYKNARYGRGPIGCGYYAGTSSISANVPQGSIVGATPDGRKAYTPLAEGCSPYHGTDVKGPTAVFKSISKLPAKNMLGGVLLNQKISPSSLQNERDILKFVALIRTFFDALKGYHVQYNVVSRETLIDAKEHPEKHRDLIVRVAGYSAFFNVLSPEIQDDIIERTEQILF